MTLTISHNYDCYYKIDNWNEASLYAKDHLTPLPCLTFSKLSNVKPTSNKILVFTIERLFFIDVLYEIKDLIYECYEKGITFVLDASIDDINIRDAKIIEKGLEQCKSFFDKKYFKILVSYNKLCIDKKWTNYFIHCNYWAHHCVHNFNKFGNPNKEKEFLFSLAIGRIFRRERLYLVNECFRRGLKDEKFFMCSPPLFLDLLQVVNRTSNFDNDIVQTSKAFLTRAKFEFNNFDVEDLIIQQDWNIEQKKYFKENINDVLNHTFVDHEGKETTFWELSKFTEKHNVPYSHWDKIIPPQIYNSWINIVPEGIDPYFSEKTYKPILAGVPFIISCIKGSDVLMKEIGFEPYYDLFDYVMPEDPFERINFIVDQLLLLREDNHVQKLLKQQLPIIKHNQEQLKKIANNFSYMKEI